MIGANLSKIWTKSFAALCFSSFFIYFTVYMLNTAFPLFVMDALDGNLRQMGLVITLWSVGVVALRLFSGRWIDRYGTKRLSAISLTLFLAAAAMYFGVSGIALLLAIRIVHGGSFAIGTTATSAMAAEMVPDSRKGEGIGYFSMFMSIAMVIGPAAGIMLVNRSDDGFALFAAGAVLSCLALICLGFVRSPEGEAVAAPAAAPARPAARGGRRRWLEREAIPISLVGFALAFSYSSLTSFISPYAKELRIDAAAGLFFVVFAATIIAFRPFAGKILDGCGDAYLVYPGVLCFAAGMALLSQSEALFGFLAAAAMMGLGYGALFPCFQTIAIRSVPAERRGVATSTFFLFFDLGFGIGSFVLGWTAGLTDYRFMFLAASASALLCGGMYGCVRRRRERIKERAPSQWLKHAFAREGARRRGRSGHKK